MTVHSPKSSVSLTTMNKITAGGAESNLPDNGYNITSVKDVKKGYILIIRPQSRKKVKRGLA